ncbi:MAG: MarR family transcriptional regulator [Pseudomonadales bacterium]
MEDQPPEVLMRGLLRAYYWMDESLQNGLIEAGFQPRTRTQTMILINISNGITRAAELARVLGVSRQAIQQQINELERDDLVTQIPDPEDRRANRIVFSERGSRLINAALTTLRAAEQALAMRLGYDAVRNLRNALASDWGEVIGGQHPRGRKRTVVERPSGSDAGATPAKDNAETTQEHAEGDSSDRSARG